MPKKAEDPVETAFYAVTGPIIFISMVVGAVVACGAAGFVFLLWKAVN